jgi:hypothetical protein
MWIKPGSQTSVMELVPKFTVLYKKAAGNEAQFSNFKGIRFV